MPAEILPLKQFVCWRYAWVDQRWSKVPYQTDGRPAKTTSPNTWQTFDAVRTAYQASSTRTDPFDGVGFVLKDGIVGFDFDHCLDARGNFKDADDGSFKAAEIEELVLRLASYTERSPSGTGLRVLAFGRLPGPRCKAGSIEMYDRARYVTLTGDHNGSTRPIASPQPAIDAIYAEVFPARSTNGAGSAPITNPLLVAADDETQLQLARDAKDGEKFIALYDRGEWERCPEFPSASEARFWLCGKLRFWLGQDPARIDAAFRASALYDEKWERVGASEIAKTLAGEVYHPPVTRWADLKGRQNGHAPSPASRPAAVHDDANDDGIEPYDVKTAGEILAELAEREAKPALYRDQYRPGEVVIVGGRAFSGKSTTMMALAKAFQTGGQFMGHPCVKTSVMYFALERNGVRGVIKKFVEWRVPEIPVMYLKPRERYETAIKRIKKTMVTFNIGVLIVDHLQNLIAVENSDKYSQVEARLAPLGELAMTTDTLIFALHIDRKTESASGSTNLMGSEAFAANADVITELQKRKDNEHFIRVQGRLGGSLDWTRIVIDLATGEAQAIDAREANTDKIFVQLASVMREQPEWLSKNELKNLCKEKFGKVGKNNDFVASLTTAVTSGVIECEDPGPGKQKHYRLRPGVDLNMNGATPPKKFTQAYQDRLQGFRRVPVDRSKNERDPDHR